MNRALLFVTFLCVASQAATFTVRISTDTLRDEKGRLFCKAYDSDDGFPMEADKAKVKSYATIAGTSAQCTLAGLAPGKYAFAVMHDANADDKMATNFLGIPREGWAVSNDAPAGTFGPPSFESAVLDVDRDLSLRLKMNY